MASCRTPYTKRTYLPNRFQNSLIQDPLLPLLNVELCRVCVFRHFDKTVPDNVRCLLEELGQRETRKWRLWFNKLSLAVDSAWTIENRTYDSKVELKYKSIQELIERVSSCKLDLSDILQRASKIIQIGLRSVKLLPWKCPQFLIPPEETFLKLTGVEKFELIKVMNVWLSNSNKANWLPFTTAWNQA